MSSHFSYVIVRKKYVLLTLLTIPNLLQKRYVSVLQGKIKLRGKKSMSFPLSCITNLTSFGRLLLIPVRAQKQAKKKKTTSKLAHYVF